MTLESKCLCTGAGKRNSSFALRRSAFSTKCEEWCGKYCVLHSWIIDCIKYLHFKYKSSRAPTSLSLLKELLETRAFMMTIAHCFNVESGWPLNAWNGAVTSSFQPLSTALIHTIIVYFTIYCILLWSHSQRGLRFKRGLISQLIRLSRSSSFNTTASLQCFEHLGASWKPRDLHNDGDVATLLVPD